MSTSIHWRDWAVSSLLHGVILLSLVWGAWHNKQHLPERLDIAIAWAVEQPPAPAIEPVPPPQVVTPPKPQPVSRVLPTPTSTTPQIAPTVNSVSAADAVVPVVPAPLQAQPVATAIAATPKVVTPMAPAAPAVNHAVQQARWHSALETAMLKTKHYPKVAERMRQEGVVTIAAEFSALGELLHCNVASGSGYKALDEAALQLVRHASELVRTSQQPGRVVSLRIPIVYELKEI